MDELTIGEVARRAKLPTSTLRYYEQVGLLPAPPRVSKQRRYSPDVLHRLSIIKLAQQAGFSIAEMVVLMQGIDANQPLSTGWHALAAKKLPELEAQLRRIEGMKRLLEAGLECGCVDLAECVLYTGADQENHVEAE